MASRQTIRKRRALVTAVPLVLVNAVAFAGQLAYINDHVSWLLPAKVIFALALESVALFLAYMAHQALMAEDSAYGLRLASYGFGAVIGLMNYSHYAGPSLAPTFEAVATGLFSLASPWLWGIYSRRQSRDVLKAKGLIEPRAVKLGALRWALFPFRTWGVFRRAAWLGLRRPDEALAAAEPQEPGTLAELFTPDEMKRPQIEAPSRSAIDLADTKAAAIRAALMELGDVEASKVSEWLAERGWPDVSPAHVRVVRSKARNAVPQLSGS